MSAHGAVRLSGVAPRLVPRRDHTPLIRRHAPVLPCGLGFKVSPRAMPLSVTPVSRIRKHTRSVRFDGYARADGLWDIEAHLTDVKLKPDYERAQGFLRAIAGR